MEKPKFEDTRIWWDVGKLRIKQITTDEELLNKITTLKENPKYDVFELNQLKNQLRKIEAADTERIYVQSKEKSLKKWINRPGFLYTSI